MSTFNLKGACDRMAVLLAAVTPPTGDHLRKAYAQAPNNAPSTPCGIFMPQSGQLTLQPGTYYGEHLIDLWFLIEKAQGDFPRIEVRRQNWLPLLLHVFDGGMSLNLSPVVQKTIAIGWEFDDLTYGGVSYDGIKVHYTVYTSETVSLAA